MHPYLALMLAEERHQAMTTKAATTQARRARGRRRRAERRRPAWSAPARAHANPMGCAV